MGAHKGRCFRDRRKTARRKAEQAARPQVAYTSRPQAADDFIANIFGIGQVLRQTHWLHKQQRIAARQQLEGATNAASNRPIRHQPRGR